MSRDVTKNLLESYYGFGGEVHNDVKYLASHNLSINYLCLDEKNNSSDGNKCSSDKNLDGIDQSLEVLNTFFFVEKKGSGKDRFTVSKTIFEKS